jgi:chromosome segregation ATPase
VQQKNSGSQSQEVKDLRTELALARQQLAGMPSSDEIDFLRTGLKNATAQLKQKDEMLARTKANADEYQKEFKEQSQEFQSLKEQLQNAYDEIHRKNEDLKYKNMEVIRLKERSTVREGDLRDQIRELTRKLEAGGKGSQGETHANKVEDRSNDPVRVKLKQALDKIDEQGRMINVLAKKLQESGQSVDLTRVQ